jgi:hypothetical protein
LAGLIFIVSAWFFNNTWCKIGLKSGSIHREVMNNMNSCELLREIKHPWFRIFPPVRVKYIERLAIGPKERSGGTVGEGGRDYRYPPRWGKAVRRLQLFPVVVLSHKWIHLYPLVGIPVLLQV